MNILNKWVNMAIAAVLTTGLTNSTSSMAEESPPVEKCYGIAKKGMSDCTTSTHPCTGGAQKDGDPEGWLFVLKGTCHKIVGGKLKKE